MEARENMTETYINVHKHARVLSYPLHPEAPRACVCPLHTAMHEEWPTDAHFTQYHAMGWRMHSSWVDGDRVRMALFVVDVDGPDHRRTPEWDLDQESRVTGLFARAGMGYMYFTRGGYRMVWGEDFTIASAADAARWSAQYESRCAWIEKTSGIHVDPSCKDWTRLFRLPLVRRKTGEPIERYPTIGSIDHIEQWRVVVPDTSAAGRERKVRRAAERRAGRAATSSASTSEMIEAFRARGWLGEYRSGKWVVRCPNEAAHSGGSRWDGSTAIFPPDGFICLHGHCTHLRRTEVMARFTTEERDAALCAETRATHPPAAVAAAGTMSMSECSRLVRDTLGRSDAHIVIISLPVGVGKTAMMAHAARELLKEAT